MRDNRILIVHDDSSACTLMTSMLQASRAQLEDADSDRAAVRRLDRGGVDLLIAGVDPEHPDALELLHYAKRKLPGLPVILLFTVANPTRCREAMQRGASAVLRFPLPATQLRAAVSQALGRDDFDARPASNHSHPAPMAEAAPVESDAGYGWTVLGEAPEPVPPAPSGAPPHQDVPVLVGEDESLRHAIELAETIATTRSPVLIEGEPGTGKSLVARALHQQSPRCRGPFVEVRGAAGHGADLERILFGERPLIGPMTLGMVEQARGGTLYIDDVTDLGSELQAKLLRLLRDGEFEPLGTGRVERADIRVVVGTREDLTEQVARDAFRQDLYYRISVVSLKLPPLRHRGADIERLAEHFRNRAARRAERPVVGFTAEALAVLRRYHWPANVRELEAAVDRAVLVCRGRMIESGDLGLGALGHPGRAALDANRRAAAERIRPLKEALEEPEKQIIIAALEALGWNRQETAKVLDINRTTLYKKMKKYGLLLDEPAWVN